jgi:hypothetical protein
MYICIYIYECVCIFLSFYMDACMYVCILSVFCMYVLHRVCIYVCVCVRVCVATVIHLFGGARGSKECGGSSMCEHQVLGVSEPYSLPNSRSHPQQQRSRARQGIARPVSFSSIHSFYIGKEVCSRSSVSFRQTCCARNLPAQSKARKARLVSRARSSVSQGLVAVCRKAA